MYKKFFAVAALTFSSLASAATLSEPGPYLNLNGLNKFIERNETNPQFIFSKVENLRGGYRVDRHAYQSFDYYNINKDYPQNYTEYTITSQHGKQSHFQKKQILMNCSAQTEMVLTTDYVPNGKAVSYSTTQGKFNPKTSSERLEACQALKNRPSQKGYQPPLEQVILNDYKIYLNEVTKSNSGLVYSKKDDNPNFKVDYYIFKDKQQRKQMKEFPDAFKVYMIGYSPNQVKVLVITHVQYNCKNKKSALRSVREFGPTGFLKESMTNTLSDGYSNTSDQFKFCESQ